MGLMILVIDLQSLRSFCFSVRAEDEPEPSSFRDDEVGGLLQASSGENQPILSISCCSFLDLINTDLRVRCQRRRGMRADVLAAREREGETWCTLVSRSLCHARTDEEEVEVWEAEMDDGVQTI